MSAPADWYPQPDGRQRYWNGQQWTAYWAPGVGSVPTTPDVVAVVGAVPPVPPWFKRDRFVLPGIALVAIVTIGLFAAVGSGPDKVIVSSPAGVSTQAQPAPEAPVADPAPAAEPAPATSTCDVVQEALLTGTPAEITSSMKALIADRTAPTTARQYARYFTVRDTGNKSQQSADESLISMSCRLP